MSIEKAVNMHDFKAAVEEGLTRKQLLERFPTLNISDIRSIAKRENLEIKRDYTPKLTLEPSPEEGNTEESKNLDFQTTQAPSAEEAETPASLNE